MKIQLAYFGMEMGKDALTGRETECLRIAFENEPPCLLSFRSFKSILAMKAAQNNGAQAIPAAPMFEKATA